ncbi:hypothetical protein EX30DRAFT_83866 [Ascodesmis nigricans]|uniref:Uncharacterized protein n=1 Tax=Ascodesmis nigricans TaxID=341454 RepID=A0A4S2N2Z1_9PEZI|nr:hypothetical protein EX30DRAFT_83866 [Ascodesmis nigricans]
MSATHFDFYTAAAPQIRRPSTFLTLAPVRSESYPKPPATEHFCHHCGSKIAPPSPEVRPSARRSSVSSTTSSNGEKKYRFLKLGPVHWGGVPGDDDYSLED